MHFIDPKELGGLHVIGMSGRSVGESDELTQVTALTDATLPGPRSVPLGGRTIVCLRDDLNFAAAPALREQLIDVLHHGTDLLILDLSHVPSCDVGGLAVLIGTQRRARLLGITMLLVAPSLPVSKVLDSTGLRCNFTIYPDLSRALAPERHEPAGQASAPAILAAASPC
jgi:anti-sigma B factor antagonist